MKKTYSGSNVQQYVGRIHFMFGDAPSDITPEDCDRMREFLLYVDAMIEDLLPDSVESHRRYLGWLASQLVIDVCALGQILKDADSFFKDFIKDETAMSSLKCFKRTFRGSFLGFFSPIYESIEEFLITREPKPFRVINTYVNFLRRINLRSLDLAKESERDYIVFEENYNLNYDDGLMTELECVITEWFKSFCYDEFIPQHGPGSVAGFAGKLPIGYKYQRMFADDRLRYFSKYVGSVNSYVPSDMLDGDIRCSEIVCVPKTLITNRVISKEPCSLAYFQQGIRRCLALHMHRQKDIRKHVCLEDQTKSQDLARRGSMGGKYATIDLSSASDSVSLAIVKRVFRKVPKLYAGLICTRSDTTKLPSGMQISLRKFAPMGSAVCFPIETIIFSACCEVASRRKGRRSQYCVYGDDIIIEEELVDELFTILRHCNFYVNYSKSFSGVKTHNFREACGGEYYDGESVAPLRIPRFFQGTPKTGSDMSADRISASIAFGNICFERGFICLRNLVLSNLRTVFREFECLAFSRDGRQGIATYADCATNWKVQQRCDVDVVIRERIGNRSRSMRGSTWVVSYRCITSVPEYDELRDRSAKRQIPDTFSEDDIRYFEWLRSHYDPTGTSKEISEDHTVNPFCIAPERISIRPSRNIMRRRWIVIQ